MLFGLIVHILLLAAIGDHAAALATYPVSPPPAVTVAAPQPKPSASIGLELTARAAVVLDVNSGAVLYQQAASRVLPLASLTKLATALTFLRFNPGWDATVTIQASDSRNGGVVVLRPGEQASVRDLFSAMLVSSSNEAAIALARTSGLDQAGFVAEMNVTARNLGLTQVHFADPAGLTPDNTAPALEIARLSVAAFAKPDIAQAASYESYTLHLRPHGERIIKSTGRHFGTFLADPARGYRVEGFKTGFLDEAGYNLTAQIDAGGRPITVTVLGSSTADSRWQELKGLAVWTYAHFAWPAQARLGSLTGQIRPPMVYCQR